MNTAQAIAVITFRRGIDWHRPALTVSASSITARYEAGGHITIAVNGTGLLWHEIPELEDRARQAEVGDAMAVLADLYHLVGRAALLALTPPPRPRAVIAERNSAHRCLRCPVCTKAAHLVAIRTGHVTQRIQLSGLGEPRLATAPHFQPDDAPPVLRCERCDLQLEWPDGFDPADLAPRRGTRPNLLRDVDEPGSGR